MQFLGDNVDVNGDLQRDYVKPTSTNTLTESQCIYTYQKICNATTWRKQDLYENAQIYYGGSNHSSSL